jgi:RNA polymerase sigma-70 factor (ECF subfamily)
VEQVIAAPTPAATRLGSARQAFGIDENAFTHLYETSRDDVFAYVAGLLRDRAVAEEVTATAFERAWRRRLRFNARRGSERAWVFAIARNAALDELRKRGRQAELRDEMPDDAAADPADATEAIARRAMLRDALANLGGRERELISLKYFGGLRNTEIAGVLGISESAVGTNLHRAMEQLRRACDGTD